MSAATPAKAVIVIKTANGYALLPTPCDVELPTESLSAMCVARSLGGRYDEDGVIELLKTFFEPTPAEAE